MSYSYEKKLRNSFTGSIRVVGAGTSTGLGTAFHASNYSVDGTLGDWEIVGGEANLYVINHKDNKKYKINLTEVS